jgi:acyl-Coa thioesterase superfamily protein/acyl-CoA thioesterase superfamily protein
MPEPSGEPVSYYVSTGPSSYRPTRHAQGAWAPDQQHMGPISGLLVQVLEECSPRPELTLSRVVFDILGVITLDEVTVQAEVVRPGRTIELLEATMIQHERVVVRAHAWRLLTSDTSQLAGRSTAPMPGPDQATSWDGSETWSGGFIASLEMKVLPDRRPGRGQVWIRPRVPVLESTRPRELARFVGMVDTMNGVAIRVPPDTATFPNTDLTVHLFRQPSGVWLGLDVEVAFGSTGVGMTSAVLHDETGEFGRALQILTLRARH